MHKPSDTCEEILVCARGLIVAGGYNGFSYADIANVVGIRKASIHHHFPNKVDLVKAIVVQHREATEAGFGYFQNTIADPLGQLRAYIQYWERCIGDMSAPFCVCAMLAGELPILPQEVAVEVRAYFRLLSGWIASVLEQGKRQGAVRLTSTPAVEAELLMATVHGAMLSARAYGEVSMFGTITSAHLERFTSRPS